MSDRVTWETCPTCGRPAALGWRDGRPVGFDCPAGCRPNDEQFHDFADRRRPVMQWLTGRRT